MALFRREEGKIKTWQDQFGLGNALCNPKFGPKIDCPFQKINISTVSAYNTAWKKPESENFLTIFRKAKSMIFCWILKVGLNLKFNVPLSYHKILNKIKLYSKYKSTIQPF